MATFIYFIIFLICALFLAIIKGTIVYSTGKHVHALTPSFIKSFGCFFTCYFIAIIYLIVVGHIEFKSVLILILIDFIIYILISVALVGSYGISGVKRIISFVGGGLLSNIILMFLLTILFGMLMHLGLSSMIETAAGAKF